MPLTKEYTNHVGIDIAKSTFEVAKLGHKKTKSFKNTPAGIELFFAEFLREPEKTLVVLENTGGYERLVLQSLCAHHIDVHKAHAVLIKRFIASFGTKAKNDPIDAKHIARYAAERCHQLKLYAEPDEQHENIRQLVERRADLVKMRVQEKNRMKAPGLDYVKKSVQKVIDLLT